MSPEHGVLIRKQSRRSYEILGQTYTAVRLRGGHDWAVIDDQGMFLFLLHMRRRNGQGRVYLHGHPGYDRNMREAIFRGLIGW